MSETHAASTDGLPTEVRSVPTEPRILPAETARNEPAAIGPGVVLNGRFLLERLLASGGMGEVWLGRDLVLGRQVAAKLIQPLDPTLRERTRYEDSLRAAFVAEARIGASLSHPAIATVFDFGFFQGEPFIIFEYLDGETLTQHIAKQSRIPLQDVQLIIGPLAQALDFAHARQVVHRDIKPDNIRATAQGHFKILDLGLAREFRSQVDWQGFAGTPAYIAPEQALELPCDGRADQYCLALIAYEMVVGQRPFRDPDWRRVVRMHIEAPPPSPHFYVPEPVSDALLKALAKDPSQRFNTCEDFALAFGCRSLTEVTRVVESLHLTSTRTPFFRARAASRKSLLGVWVGVTQRHLCLVYLEEVRIIELRSLFQLQKRGLSVVEVSYISNGNESSEFLAFWSPWKRRAWLELVQPLLASTRQEAERCSAVLQVRPRVTQLRKAATARHQVLGSVEFSGTAAREVSAGMEMQAALLGANAISRVERERVPRLGRTLKKLSGVAIRTIDQEGQQEITQRAMAVEIAALTFRIFAWLLVLLGLTSWNMFAADFEPYAVIGAMSALFFWPITATLILRWTKWPRLIKPTVAVLFALTGALVWGWTASPSRDVLFSLILEGIALAYPIRLVRRAWETAERYEAFSSTLPRKGWRIPRGTIYAMAWVFAFSWALSALPLAGQGLRYHGNQQQMELEIASDTGISELKQAGPEHAARAEQAFRKMVALATARVAQHRADWSAHMLLAQSQINLGLALAAGSKYVESEAALNAAKQTVDTCWSNVPGCPYPAANRAREQINSLLAANRFRALPHAQEAEAAGAALTDGLASYNKVPRDLDAAENHFVSAARMFQALAQQSDALPEYMDSSAVALFDLGLVYLARDDAADAQTSFEAAIEQTKILRQRAPQFQNNGHPDIARQAQGQLDALRAAAVSRKVSIARNELATAITLSRAATPDLQQVEVKLQAAIRDWKELTDMDPSYRPILVQAYFDLGWIYLTQQKFAQAEKPLRSCLRQIDLIAVKTAEMQALQDRIRSILAEKAMNHPPPTP